jgi:hypothetical protein
VRCLHGRFQAVYGVAGAARPPEASQPAIGPAHGRQRLRVTLIDAQDISGQGDVILAR